MRLKLFPLVFFLCAIPLLVHSSPEDVVDETAGTGVEIRSDPSGATVFLDGMRKGKTPLVISDISVGTHDVELIKDGYLRRSVLINVKEGSRLVVVLELEKATGIVSIEVRPRGESAARTPFRPQVFVDDEPSFLGAVRLKEGFHTIRARAFGWEDQTRVVYVERGFLSRELFELSPALFKISDPKTSRQRFNPKNPGLLGTAVISFQASAPGNARVIVKEKDGGEVFRGDLGPFETWEQSLGWNGRREDGTVLWDGEYIATIQAESIPAPGERSVEQIESVSIVIDSSMKISPASMSNASGGLSFAADAHLFPALSYQLEASLLAGYPYGADGAFEAPPFAFGLRVAPATGWEIAAAVNLAPTESDETATTLGLSLRRLIVEASAARPFAAALNLKYAWASSNPMSAFGMRSGVEISFPMELSLGPAFSLDFAPGLLFGGLPGNDGDATPRVELAGGIAHRGETSVVSLSTGTELRFGAGMPTTGPLLAGGEVKFYPPPSILVYSLSGGAWFDGSDIGTFFGVGFGILH